MVMGSGVVLVTGGTGFLGSAIVHTALETGYTVRTTVRDLSNEKKCSYLNSLIRDGAKLEVVQADLSDTVEHWKKIVEGCEYVIHSASPFYYNNATKEELVKPAVEGTEVVLKAAFAAGGVKHLVVTSSVAAIYYIADPEKRTEDLTEADWSVVDSKISDYARSKTLAERAAWAFVAEKAKSGEECFQLSTINPVYIIGPPLYKLYSTSVDYIVAMMDGSLSEVKNDYFNIVDVRDVARAHLVAMISPKANGNRYIVWSKKMHFYDIADIIRKELEPFGYKIAPNGRGEKAPVGTAFSSEKIRKELAFEFTDSEKTIRDMAHAIAKYEFVPMTDAYRKYLQQQQ